ncbi:cell division protein FtsX [Rubrobacter xylanophilus DSM 9941]|uniref:Cell division protein FtsX n=1 Tax=Rubrobacter xylanophilus (strain DSM 9941 / JCM 11954 / NBRC 16129 / PRD-1) TaxID=266117 RepID=Q1AVL1_RUBXD|nr:permease-like cell division protein FtsX [Rubrobacter xylanophilus]ABG04567.1 cell division protein FtsX [Rubrobacter xylanophilus DSM 9941]
MRFNLGFFLREAAKNIRHNFLMSLTAMTTTFICILVLGLGLLVSSHVEGVVGAVKEDVNIEVYLPDDATQKEIDALRERVAGYPEVSGVEYVSKEEAFDRFKETFRDNPEIYRGIGEDVLPASLEIRLHDPSMADRVAERLRGEEGIGEEDLNYPRQTIDRLNTVTGYMIWGLYGATALFLIASVLLISNAIRLSIFARRKEIEVMKLVGASDGFVRWPFVFEGLLQGLVGAGLAAVVVIWLNFLFVDWAQDALPFVPISSGAVDTLFVLLVLVAVGVAIGVVGSFLSVTRFLKV